MVRQARKCGIGCRTIHKPVSNSFNTYWWYTHRRTRHIIHLAGPSRGAFLQSLTERAFLQGLYCGYAGYCRDILQSIIVRNSCKAFMCSCRDISWNIPLGYSKRLSSSNLAWDTPAGPWVPFSRGALLNKISIFQNFNFENVFDY